MADGVSRGDVIAFRLGAHHLAERLGEDGLLDAAGRCGVQNSPPGSALLALHARVSNLTQERVDDVVAGEKSLLQSWCMRGAAARIRAGAKALAMPDALVAATAELDPEVELLLTADEGIAELKDLDCPPRLLSSDG